MNKKIVATSKKQDLAKLGKANNLKDLCPSDSRLDQVIQLLKKDRFWDAALLIGEFYNSLDNKTYSEAIKLSKELIDDIRATMGVRAKNRKDATTVVFGTSGWRGKIGEDFTVYNVHKVTRGIIDMMRTDEFLKTNGYLSFEDVQSHGIVVFRDNRFMGDEFMDVAMKELANAGIKIYFAGECPTGVGSALVTELGAAGSINFTPSHNPMDYAGLKFNPADGGPADTNLTNIIEQKSKQYMSLGDHFIASNPNIKEINGGRNYVEVNDAKIFSAYIEKQFASGKGLLDIVSIRKFLSEKKDDLYILVDNMHGSSRGKLQEILGNDLVADLVKNGAMEFINTEDDYSFHGVKPEPNEKNQKVIIDRAKAKVEAEPKRRMTLVVSLDPDADRIRFGTANSDINMNTFGAIAYGYLLKKGILGPIATTLPSSKFAVAIANIYNQKVYETLVGFKWFRPLIDALVKYEESDGISFMGHTQEKDGIAGFLMALQIMKDQNKDIYSFFKDLQAEFGYYYAKQAPQEVKSITIDEWRVLRKDIEKDLQLKYQDAKTFWINGVEKKVVSTRVDDGIMMVFDDNSWILVRSSGTEAKFRVYYEITSRTELTEAQVSQTQEQYANAGLAILNQALSVKGR